MYSSVSEVRAILARDQDDQGGTGAILEDAVIESNLKSASDQIDGIIRGLYKLPLTAPVPTVVSGIARDIAAWLCDLTFREWREQDDRHPVALRYARAQEMLRQISKGTLVLSGQTAASEEQVAADGDVVEVIPDSAQSELFCASDYFGPIPRRTWDRWC